MTLGLLEEQVDFSICKALQKWYAKEWVDTKV